MKRREFLKNSAVAIAASSFTFDAFASSTLAAAAERTYHVLGVPFRSGSLYPGNENDAQSYRDAHFVERLQRAGCKAVDDGDIAIPSYLPHHTVPPIRSWPGPRIAWECVSERVAPLLKQAGQIPLMIGCDCSVGVGTTQAMIAANLGEAHVIYVDGDFDDAAPDASKSTSAASLATWLLTQPSPFWAGPTLKPSQVTVVGWTRPSRSNIPGIKSVSMSEVRQTGAANAAAKVLAAIPDGAPVLLHIDIDVIQGNEMPAAYFPHPEGLTLAEASALLRPFLQDPRVRLIEVSEYAALRDGDQRQINKLVDVLAAGLRR